MQLNLISNFNQSFSIFKVLLLEILIFNQGFLSTPPSPNLPGDKHEFNRRIIPFWVFRTSKNYGDVSDSSLVMKKNNRSCLGHIGDFVYTVRIVRSHYKDPNGKQEVFFCGSNDVVQERYLPHLDIAHLLGYTLFANYERNPGLYPVCKG